MVYTLYGMDWAGSGLLNLYSDYAGFLKMIETLGWSGIFTLMFGLDQAYISRNVQDSKKPFLIFMYDTFKNASFYSIESTTQF